MDFKFHIGTKVYFGKGCLKNNSVELGQFGKKAFIVSGKSSGKASGALDDVIEILKTLNVEYLVYDKVENNPTLENVKDGGVEAARFGADFVIGIGGGSPLDAAKAVAVLAVNAIEPLELYKNVFEKKPLPIIAVPTTAGTGSEVTPYSILTRRDMNTKMSFGNDDTFPKVAYIDPAYTESMVYEVTVNTAVDAFSHAVEGYLSKRSTPTSDILAVEAIRLFGECIGALTEGKINYEVREKLLYVSMLGGMVIAHTGTTIVHGMGYSLTYFKDIPHGKANGLIMAEYFKFIYKAGQQKLDTVLSLLNMDSIEEFGLVMKKLLPTEESFTDEEIKQYAGLAMKQKSVSYNLRSVSEEDMVQIMKNCLL